MSNRSAVFAKIAALVAQVPNCRVVRTVFSQSEPTVPISVVIDPLDQAATFRTGDERDNYAICFMPEGGRQPSVRLDHHGAVTHLALLVYQSSYRYTTRRYVVQADGSFNVERVKRVLEEYAQAARARHARHSVELDRQEEWRLRRLEYARRVRSALGEPFAFASYGVKTQEELAREDDPSGLYHRMNPHVSARILETGDGVRLEATVRNPETFARIVDLLRQESVG